MSTQALLALYLAAGLVLGGLVYARAPGRGALPAASALATVVLWPLWAPFALAPRPLPHAGPFTERITRALLQSPPGDPRQAVLSRVEATDILRRVEASERRLDDLDALLAARPDQSDDSAASALGQVRVASIAQLRAVRAREHAALQELAELCELLQTHYVLSRYGTSGRPEELRDELWARVQALSELQDSG